MRRRWFVAAGAAVVALSAGCSSGSADLTGAGQRAIAPFVHRVRVAAASGDPAQLQSAVAKLQRVVDRQRAAGTISDQRASDIGNAAVRLENDFHPSPSPSDSLLPSTTPPVTPPPTSPTPTTPTTTITPPPPTKTITPTGKPTATASATSS